MIRSKSPSDSYRDGWDRVFGETEPVERNTDAIECRIRLHLSRCRVCDALVSDPENHQEHAIITTVPGANAVASIDGDAEP